MLIKTEMISIHLFTRTQRPRKLCCDFLPIVPHYMVFIWAMFFLSNALWTAACAGDRRETGSAKSRCGAILGEEVQSNRKDRLRCDAVRHAHRFSWRFEAMWVTDEMTLHLSHHRDRRLRIHCEKTSTNKIRMFFR